MHARDQPRSLVGHMLAAPRSQAIRVEFTGRMSGRQIKRVDRLGQRRVTCNARAQTAPA